MSVIRKWSFRDARELAAALEFAMQETDKRELPIIVEGGVFRLSQTLALECMGADMMLVIR